MDLIELRILAVAGILTVGIVLSALAASAAALIEWIDRSPRSRVARPERERATRRRPVLDAGPIHALLAPWWRLRC